MGTYIIREYTNLYRVDDAGPELESSSCKDFDVENGLADHVAMAIDFLRNSAFVTKASMCPLDNSKHMWLTSEIYRYPYSGSLEEHTYHFEGDWTDSEVWQIVIAALAK